MATLFVLIIFFLYIGLGLPDSAFGTVIPAMWAELNLPLSLASVVSLIISAGTTISAFLSDKLINKLGTGLVVALSTTIAGLALLGFSLTGSFWFTCLMALPLGLGAGAIDSAINSYVAVRYSSSIMSFLHCFYGIGVALTPLIFSFTLSNNNNWRLGYVIIFGIMLVLSVTAFLVVPLWKKQQKKSDVSEEIIPVNVSYKRMAKSSAIRAVWVAFFMTCALEFTCDTWGATYLVAQGLSESGAARFVTLYYVGITLGRFFSGILNKFFSPKKVIATGFCSIALGITVLFLPVSVILKGISLFFIGLGNGPVFPNLTFVTPMHFGKEASVSLVASQMVASNLGIMILPPLFGVIAQVLTVNLFPVFLAVFFVLLAVYTVCYFKRPKTVF